MAEEAQLEAFKDELKRMSGKVVHMASSSSDEKISSPTVAFLNTPPTNNKKRTIKSVEDKLDEMKAELKIAEKKRAKWEAELVRLRAEEKAVIIVKVRYRSGAFTTYEKPRSHALSHIMTLVARELGIPVKGLLFKSLNNKVHYYESAAYVNLGSIANEENVQNLLTFDCYTHW